MTATPSVRSRRLRLMQSNLRQYQHALNFFAPYPALSQTFGLQATWEAVRRLASTLLRYKVRDVRLAWRVVDFVKVLPDGPERLKEAADEVVETWQREIDSLMSTEESA